MSAILVSPAARSTREPQTAILAPGIPSGIAKIYTTSGARLVRKTRLLPICRQLNL
ncbi:hypothetical protein [Microcoleus sp. herbarium12]|uniref:hypothetical protein n=1 Tax=Microcoleus sp. herbarium12 TaxID=3055437 RepID=UPI002FD40188